MFDTIQDVESHWRHGIIVSHRPWLNCSNNRFLQSSTGCSTMRTLALFVFVATAAGLALAGEPATNIIRIGLTKSMLPPDEEKKFEVVANNFKEVLMQQSGLTGEPE